MIQIDRLRAMATEAIREYQSGLTGGSEPSYPQWADDLLVVCDRAEASLPINVSSSIRRAEPREYSFSAA
ncbi:MAG: hypothetical protein JWR65_2329 [Massilia sp.]|jgi:hypothetical protein|nr:hypothetical protein [Massilia sp.]